MTSGVAINPLTQPDLARVVTNLAERCESLPGAILCADNELVDVRPAVSRMGWLTTYAGGLARIVSLARQLYNPDEGEPVGMPMEEGLILLVLPIVQRRRRVGVILCVVATTQLPDHPKLREFSESTTEDRDPCAQLALQSLSPPSAVPTLLQAIQWWLRDLSELHAAQNHMNSFGEQLTDVYEELALLQRVGRNMNVVRQPREFLEAVCADLEDVMPFAWTAVRILGNKSGCQSLSRSLSLAGELPCTQQELMEAVDEVLKSEPTDTIIMERGLTKKQDRLSSLDRTIIFQPLSDSDGTFGAILAGGKVGDHAQITSFDVKLLNTTGEHVRIFLDNVALYDGLERMFLGTLEALSTAIDAKDRYTCGHSRRVAFLSRELAREAGLSRSIVERVHISGLVHDVGKIGVPESVLCKPGRLTDEEFALIKKHPEIGVRILRDIPNFEDIIPGVMSHHERYDGRGYPHNLAGEEIPLFGRIIGIADAFDAMSSTRTYRRALSATDVIEEISRCAGSQFDPELVPHFLRIDFTAYEQMRESDRALELPQGEVAA